MRVLIVLALVSACFDPEETDGDLRCGPGGECPTGFLCGDDDRCWRDETSEPVTPADDDAAPADAASGAACANGIDDDCDGLIDDEDPGCSNADDSSEKGTKQCDDGIDNDDDGVTDFHAAGCGTAPSDSDCTKPDDEPEGDG